MKNCPGCNAVMEDETVFCTVCGAKFDEADAEAPKYESAEVFDAESEVPEFTAEDISNNKPIAMLAYLGGTIGLILAAICKKDSAFVDFHFRQSLKIYIVELLATLICAIGSVLIIPALIAPVVITILLVVRIICFVNVAKGVSKEPAIVKGFKFLK